MSGVALLVVWVCRRDHPQLYRRVGQGAFGVHGGRAVGLHQQGFCIFRPSDPHWLSVIETAHLEASAGSSSPALKQLAVHSELTDLLTICYGRQAYASQFSVTKDCRKSEPSTIADEFQAEPDGFLCGAWIALEDIVAEAEAFCLYPGSHRIPPLRAEHQLYRQRLQENGFNARLIRLAAEMS